MIYEPFEGESDNSFWGVGTANYVNLEEKATNKGFDCLWVKNKQ